MNPSPLNPSAVHPEPGPSPLLGVWAHPDDEAYLSAGLMAEVVAAGGSVTLVVVTDGELGFADDDPRDLASRAGQRRREMAAAMAGIGVDDIRFLGHPDGAAERVDTGIVADAIAAVMRDVRPARTVTFGPDGMTGHRDHVAAGLAATSAWLDTRIGDLAYAAVDPSWLDEWRAMHDELGVWMGEEPPPAEPSAIVWSARLTGDALERKRTVLAAHTSQTAPVAQAMGEANYRRWIAEEMFRRPSARELAAAVVAAEWGNRWELLAARRPVAV